MDGEQEASLIALTCRQQKEGREWWTLHVLADTLVELRLIESTSRETVRQVLHTNERTPWLTEPWYLLPTRSAECVGQMKEVRDMSTHPSDAWYPPVCMDEMSTQRISETRVPLPMPPGHPACDDSEEER